MTREQAKQWSRLAVTFDNHIDKIYDDFEARIAELEALQAPKSCDKCKYRVNHSYYDGIQIDKCSIRDQLHFNGLCDGLVCTKYEPKGVK